MLSSGYLVVVTKIGIVRKDQVTGIRSDFECRNIALLYCISEKTILPVLEEIYPYLYGRIINYVILKNIPPLPMKSMSPGSISGMFSSLPEDQSIQIIRKLTESGEYILMDSTAIFSRIKGIY